jgi:hypothetical protein
MTGRRPKKAGGIVLRWQKVLQECGDVPSNSPPRYAVVAVSAVLVSFADSDGRNCRPAIETIVRMAGVSKRTVVLVLDWMVEEGWLRVTAKISRRPTVYRLVTPVGADEHLRLGDVEHLPDEPVGAVVGAVVGAPEHQNLRPPSTNERGREGAVVRSVYTPLTAPPVDLFSDEVEVDHDMVRRIAYAIASEAGREIEAPRLGPALMAAKARVSDWNEQDFVDHCVKKLLQHDPPFPTGFLVADLGRVQGGTVPPRVARRKVYADLVEQLDDLGKKLDPDGHFPIDDLPGVRFENLLAEAGLIGEDDGRPLTEQVPADQLDQFIKLARRALRETKADRRDSPDW